MWMTADVVAEQGYGAVMRNVPVYVNGRVNRMIVFLAKHLPDAVTFRMARASSKRIHLQ
jgi:hypothetical protein